MHKGVLCTFLISTRVISVVIFLKIIFQYNDVQKQLHKMANSIKGKEACNINFFIVFLF